MNKSVLKQFLKARFPNLDDSILETLSAHTNYIKHAKGTKLISEGKRHPYFYFLIQGSVKAYYLKNSKEVCSWFAFENHTVANCQNQFIR